MQTTKTTRRARTGIATKTQRKDSEIRFSNWDNRSCKEKQRVKTQRESLGLLRVSK